jgi:hypothetical protein
MAAGERSGAADLVSVLASLGAVVGLGLAWVATRLLVRVASSTGDSVVFECAVQLLFELRGAGCVLMNSILDATAFCQSLSLLNSPRRGGLTERTPPGTLTLSGKLRWEIQALVARR